jgi:hypothetical protein
MVGGHGDDGRCGQGIEQGQPARPTAADDDHQADADQSAQPKWIDGIAATE